MHSKALSWSRNVYLAGIVLALVLVVPTAWFPFQLGKLAVFSICLAIAALFYVFGGGVPQLMRAHGIRGALLVALLPLVYLFSSWFSIDSSVAFAGFGIEVDTILFTTLAFLAFLLSFGLFRTLRTLHVFSTVVFWALAAAVVFQYVSIVFGGAAIPFETFADRSVNLIGKWNDLGLLTGLLLVFVLFKSELAPVSTLRKGLLAASGAVMLILLAFINFPLAWALVLAGSLALAAVAFVTARNARQQEPEAIPAQKPWLALAVAAIAIVFLLFGQTLNTGLTKVFPVSSLEVRPSYEATMEIVGAAHGGNIGRLLIGTGPNTFGQQWLQHKPVEVNQSVFWNLDFLVGYSTLTTALATVGLVGVLALLIPLALVVAGLVRVTRRSLLAREDRAVALTAAFGSIFLLATLVFYAPSPNLVLLAFAFAGAAYGFLWRQGQSAPTPEEEVVPVRRILTFVTLGVLVVLVVGSSLFVVRRFFSEMNVGRGLVALAANDPDRSLKFAEKATGWEQNSSTLRLMVNAGGLKLAALAEDTSLGEEELQQRFATILQQTIAAGQRAQEIHPYDYRAPLLLGRVYDFLAVLGVQGARDSARTSYENAAMQNPTNPEIPLLLARLEAANENMPAVEAHLQRSLTLKPNYTDAMLLVTQLAVANNDLATAINASRAAVASAPGVPSIWFGLGLLYYAGGDTAQAIPALEQAIVLVPDYANAKYFLGLSYAAVGRSSDAIAQFEALVRTNPESQEVALILNNLRAGNDPFEGAEPPVTPNPEERNTAPLAE